MPTQEEIDQANAQIKSAEDFKESERAKHRYHKTRDDQTHKKATENLELTFTIREQDKTAAITIAFWILANIETAPATKLRDALDTAIMMRTFKSRKYPD